MNEPSHRDMISHAVIIVAVCVGAWMLFVQPNTREIAQHEATIAAAAADSGSLSQADVEAAAKRMSQIRARLDQITKHNELSQDSSRLFGLIMDKAQTHRVKILNMSPGARGKGSDQDTVSATRIDMAAQGRFDDVAAFLDSVDSIDGFIRPVSLSMVPLHDEGPGVVTVRFSCEAVKFVLPESLASMTGGTHGQR